jgi:hypothetical protein
MITEDNCYPIDILSYLIMFYILSNYYFILCTKRIYQQKSGILVDEYNLFDVALILEVVSLYHDEPEPEVALFNDDEEKNNLTHFELIAFKFDILVFLNNLNYLCSIF